MSRALGKHIFLDGINTLFFVSYLIKNYLTHIFLNSFRVIFKSEDNQCCSAI